MIELIIALVFVVLLAFTVISPRRFDMITESLANKTERPDPPKAMGISKLVDGGEIESGCKHFFCKTCGDNAEFCSEVFEHGAENQCKGKCFCSACIKYTNEAGTAAQLRALQFLRDRLCDKINEVVDISTCMNKIGKSEDPDA